MSEGFWSNQMYGKNGNEKSSIVGSKVILKSAECRFYICSEKGSSNVGSKSNKKTSRPNEDTQMLDRNPIRRHPGPIALLVETSARITKVVTGA